MTTPPQSENTETGAGVPARAPAGAGGHWRALVRRGQAGEGGGGLGSQRSPRQLLLHTQVLLSAGVLPQLLAKD